MTEPQITSRPPGITALGALFAFGTLASGLSVVSLLTPGGSLEPLWRLNPRAREAFAGMGTWAPLLLGTVCLACAASAYGFFRGKRWGYRLGILLLLVNLTGDLVNAALGIEPRAVVGVPIVALLLWYLSSSRVRTFFMPTARNASALLTFFVVTYLVTWSFWLAASSIPAGAPRELLFFLGVFAPGFAALWLTARATGRSGVAALLRRLVDWQVPARWYVFAVSYIAVVKLTVALVHRAATGAWPRFGQEPWYLMLAATVGSTLVGGQAGEELGWRGYALPRLAARFGLGGGSVLLGLLWASWHLPLFFISGTDTAGQSFLVYLLQVTALSVAMAWLFAHTRGSLLPVMLMHAAVNNTKDIVPSAEPNATNPWAPSHSLVAWLSVALLSLCAGYFLLRMRKNPQLAREAAHSVAT